LFFSNLRVWFSPRIGFKLRKLLAIINQLKRAFYGVKQKGKFNQFPTKGVIGRNRLRRVCELIPYSG